MSKKIIIIFAILIVVLGSVAFLNVLKIEEKIADWRKEGRLPLAAEVKENIILQEETFDPQKYMAERKPIIHLVAVGDIMLSRNVGQEIVKHKDYKYPFLKTAPFLQEADIVFGNLESPLYRGPPVESPSMIFRADPECAEALAWTGFNVLSLASNHILNQGEKGLVKTLELLSEEEILGVGAGRNKEEAHTSKIITKKGIKIAFLAYVYPGNPEAGEDSGGVAIMKTEELKEDVERARRQADLVVVSMHAGTEYTRYPNERQIGFAHSAIDFGADLVLGHHPHWFQTVERYKDKYILYSLGNFVFDQMWSEETREGMVASIFLDQKGVRALEFLPIKIENYSQPHFVGGESKEKLLSFLGLEFQKMPLFWGSKDGFEEKSRDGIFGSEPFSSVPEVQRADLDGDGKEEKIIWQEGKISVFRGEEKIWEQDSSWLTTDYALGDFNQDGFLELALALWKKGDYAAGSPLEISENKEHWASHLFLYNFREGEGKIVWGSSILPRPILELAAGDANRDGVAELVVLEGNYNEPYGKVASNLAILQWDAWGFKKIWEKAGSYYNLRIYPAPEASIAVSKAD